VAAFEHCKRRVSSIPGVAFPALNEIYAAWVTLLALIDFLFRL
jgi:hypothetical protein